MRVTSEPTLTKLEIEVRPGEGVAFDEWARAFVAENGGTIDYEHGFVLFVKEPSSPLS